MKKINFNRALVAKKKLLFFLLPALMLFAVGCKDKNQPEELPQTLSVNPELITCPDAGGDYTLTLTSPNGAWSATTNDSWIRVTPTSGEKGTAEVRIKISPNSRLTKSPQRPKEKSPSLPATRPSNCLLPVQRKPLPTCVSSLIWSSIPRKKEVLIPSG